MLNSAEHEIFSANKYENANNPGDPKPEALINPLADQMLHQAPRL